ncbi:MAG: outer membrane protein assembly factor BamC, partial [Telluria sp.]
MMNRKFKTHHAGRAVALTLVSLSLAACTTVFESDKVDYRSAKKAAPLDIPPDLTQLQKDNRYAVPDGRGVATASGFQQARGNQALPAVAGGTVGPVSTDAVRIERAGDERWLVVKQTPEQLWPQLEAFWPSVGFTVETENAQTGIMETNWAENRAKIPMDIIRRTIGKVFDSAYSSGERDKFRTRLERRPDGSTEIYISHRGAEEVPVGAQRETTTWVGRKSDPGLEAEFLGRLMAQLTGATKPADVKAATAAVVNATPEAQHAKLENGK